MVLLRTEEMKKLENQKKFSLKDGFHQKYIEDRINGSTQGNDKQNLTSQKKFLYKKINFT